MEENRPQTSRPQDGFIRAVDLSNTEHRRALAEMAEARILSKSDMLNVLDRLDPNNEQEMLTTLVILDLELPFDLSARDFDTYAQKIDPNTLSGSYSGWLLESENLLTSSTKEVIKQKIDFAKVDYTSSSTEFGSVLANLVQGHFISVAIERNPVLSFEAISQQRGAFN